MNRNTNHIQITCSLRCVCDFRAEECKVLPGCWKDCCNIVFIIRVLCAHTAPVCEQHGAHIIEMFHFFWSVVRRKSRRTSPRSHTSTP